MSASRPTILVVDGHSAPRDALMALLEHEGFQVADASNRAEALDYLRSGEPVNAPSRSTVGATRPPVPPRGAIAHRICCADELSGSERRYPLPG